MRERIRPADLIGGAGPAGLGDIFSDGDGPAAMASVAHGVYAEQLPVGGMSVGQIRARYRDRFDMDTPSQANLDGSPVGDDIVVRPGQALTFISRSGEKGR